MLNYLRRHWLAITLVLVLVLGGASSYVDSRAREAQGSKLTQQLTENTVQGCLRARTFKLEMIGFLEDAAVARYNSAKLDNDPVQRKIDYDTAKRYRLREDRIRSTPVNCDAAYSPVP